MHVDGTQSVPLLPRGTPNPNEATLSTERSNAAGRVYFSIAGHVYFSIFSNGQTSVYHLKRKQALKTSDIPFEDYRENSSTCIPVEDLLASKHKALVDRARRQTSAYSLI